LKICQCCFNVSKNPIISVIFFPIVTNGET
jgi:hypothetical protein